MHDKKSAIRFGLLMDAFLRGCGDGQKEAFIVQLNLCSQLERIARLVQGVPPARRRHVMQQELVDLPIPMNFQNPVEPMVGGKREGEGEGEGKGAREEARKDREDECGFVGVLCRNFPN